MRTEIGNSKKEFILSSYDLINECWDFQSEDTKEIKSRIRKYFYSELSKHHSRFNQYGTQKVHLQNPEERQCKKCLRVLLLKSNFKIHHRTKRIHKCYKCYYAKYRDRLLRAWRRYYYFGKGKETHKRYNKEYNQRPYVKERLKNYNRENMRKWRLEKAEYIREYNSRPEVKENRNKTNRLRYAKNKLLKLVA
jgi:hypothetical protein